MAVPVALGERSRRFSRNPQVVGSSPTRDLHGFFVKGYAVFTFGKSLHDLNTQHSDAEQRVNHGISLALKHVNTPLTEGQHLQWPCPIEKSFQLSRVEGFGGVMLRRCQWRIYKNDRTYLGQRSRRFSCSPSRVQAPAATLMVSLLKASQSLQYSHS